MAIGSCADIFTMGAALPPAPVIAGVDIEIGITPLLGLLSVFSAPASPLLVGSAAAPVPAFEKTPCATDSEGPLAEQPVRIDSRAVLVTSSMTCSSQRDLFDVVASRVVTRTPRYWPTPGTFLS
jgi:hypothetical protein